MKMLVKSWGLRLVLAMRVEAGESHSRQLASGNRVLVKRHSLAASAPGHGKGRRNQRTFCAKVRWLWRPGPWPGAEAVTSSAAGPAGAGAARGTAPSRRPAPARPPWQQRRWGAIPYLSSRTEQKAGSGASTAETVRRNSVAFITYRARGRLRRVHRDSRDGEAQSRIFHHTPSRRSAPARPQQRRWGGLVQSMYPWRSAMRYVVTLSLGWHLPWFRLGLLLCYRPESRAGVYAPRACDRITTAERRDLHGVGMTVWLELYEHLGRVLLVSSGDGRPSVWVSACSVTSTCEKCITKQPVPRLTQERERRSSWSLDETIARTYPSCHQHQIFSSWTSCVRRWLEQSQRSEIVRRNDILLV